MIDDLQWADADSLAALTEILRPPSPPLFLLATARAPNEPRTNPDAPPFELPGDVHVLPLTRLTHDEGLELVTLLGGNMSPSVRQRIGVEEAAATCSSSIELSPPRRSSQVGARPGANVHLDDARSPCRAPRTSHAGARGVLELLAVSGVALPQETAMRAAAGLCAFGDFCDLTLQTPGPRTSRGPTQRRVAEDAIEAYHDRVREGGRGAPAPGWGERESAATCASPLRSRGPRRRTPTRSRSTASRGRRRGEGVQGRTRVAADQEARRSRCPSIAARGSSGAPGCWG